MNMRKRRKHAAGIPGRDAFTLAMWGAGMLSAFVAVNHRWVQVLRRDRKE